MSVGADDVVAGSFFRTRSNQIWAVLEVKDGTVKFEAGAPDYRNRKFGPRQSREIDSFLKEVEEQVEETWDPDYLHPEHRKGGLPTDSES